MPAASSSFSIGSGVLCASGLLTLALLLPPERMGMEEFLREPPLDSPGSMLPDVSEKNKELVSVGWIALDLEVLRFSRDSIRFLSLIHI